MIDFVLALLPLAGAILAAHGLSVAWRELRTGVGSVALPDYPRSAQVAGFLAIIFVNALLVLVGLFLLTVGLLALIAAVKP